MSFQPVCEDVQYLQINRALYQLWVRCQARVAGIDPQDVGQTRYLMTLELGMY